VVVSTLVLGPPKKLVEQEDGRHTRTPGFTTAVLSGWCTTHNTEVVFVEDNENTTHALCSQNKHGICSMPEPSR
jgi:hypothetical protein